MNHGKLTNAEKHEYEHLVAERDAWQALVDLAEHRIQHFLVKIFPELARQENWSITVDEDGAVKDT